MDDLASFLRLPWLWLSDEQLQERCPEPNIASRRNADVAFLKQQRELWLLQPEVASDKEVEEWCARMCTDEYGKLQSAWYWWFRSEADAALFKLSFECWYPKTSK